MKIEYSEDRETWEVWDEDEDCAALLREFVEAVNDERIDEVNLYWRVTDGEET